MILLNCTPLTIYGTHFHSHHELNHLSQSRQPMAHYENHWKTKNPSKINIIDLTTNAPEQLNVDFKVILRYNHPLYPVVIKA